MRVSQEEKQRSRARIVAGAARLMRQHGIEGASVNDVMQAAGMSHGGFYKHFESKEASLLAALDLAFEESATRLGSNAPEGEATALTARFIDHYLYEGHVHSPGLGCPVATLGADIGRGSAEAKAHFGAGVRRIAALLARAVPGAERARRARALRQLAMMAGAVLIARASDAETAQEVLAACREPAR